LCSVFNATMPARIPKSLKQKRNELTRQRQNLVKAIQKIDREIRTLDYAIKLIAPDWQPPTGLHRTYKANKFRRGVITKACLEVIVHLKDQFETRELARRAAKICKAKFESKAAEESFYPRWRSLRGASRRSVHSRNADRSNGRARSYGARAWILAGGSVP
jgi:hypothetical protein